MLDLESAIKHCEEVATENEKSIAYYTIQGDKEWLDECEKDCIECAKEHRQLAEWLRELQRWREFGGRIANVCASYITEEQKEKLLEIMEVNADDNIQS